MKKATLIGCTSLFALLGIGLWFVFQNLDSIVHTAIEKVGTEVLKVSVQLEDVKIDPANGTGVLRGLTIANPKGFGTGEALSLDKVKVVISLKTITEPVILIKEISINQPAITYEWSQMGSNLEVIQKNVLAGTSKQSSKNNSTSEGPKLVIEDFFLRKSQVSFSADFLKGKKISKTLKTIHLQNLGKKNSGASPQQIAQKIFHRLTSEIRPLASRLSTDTVRNLANQEAKKVKNRLQKAIPKKSLTGTFGL